MTINMPSKNGLADTTSATPRIAEPDAPRTLVGDNTQPQRFDVAVVGGGLAGLAAAASAARDGRSAILFEQSPVPGGRARTRTEDGFSFNIGPHALYRDGFSLAILRDLGVEPKAGTLG